MICVVDDLESPEPAQFQWLMHAPEQLELDVESQTLVSRRGDTQMLVHLLTPSGFDFSLTNAWPVAPKEGYPTAKKPEPKKLWHFAAATRQRSATRRIAAVMSVGDERQKPVCDVRMSDSDVVRIQAKTTEAETVVEICLSSDRIGGTPLFEVRCRPTVGDEETLTAE